MMTSLETRSTKSRPDVEKSARAVYGFLENPGSALRRFMLATSDGGVHFVSSVWARTGEAYLARRQLREDDPAVGVSMEHFVNAIQARVCE